MAMRDKIEHAIQNQPCTVKDLKNKFGGDRGADRKVMEAVDQLVHEAVICQRQGVFFTVRSGRADKALLCKVVKLGKNFAFVMLEDGTSDIFIPGRFTRGAMPGDKVLVEKFAHPRVEGSDEGEILAVLEEKNSLVGTMHRVEGRLKFVPDDCPAISMQVMRDCEGSAKDGDKVAVEILLRGNRQEDHRVGVAMRFGSCDEAKRCAKALLYAQDIRNRFPDKVRDEAKKLDNAEVSAADCEGRMDLRALPIFTIDSAETKDIDDAISLTKTPDGGFELGVHIADVSNYVKPGSELDNEAFNRATSVYYADQVVPMLPKQLSNGICSLNEGVLRLAFSCLMRLDKDGNLTAVAESDANSWDIPLVVLADETTGGTTELFVMALQDFGRAKVVGARTAGNGDITEIFKLSGGSAIQVTTAQYAGPKQKSFGDTGVGPDYEVELAASESNRGDILGNAELDAPYKKALEVLAAAIR